MCVVYGWISVNQHLEVNMSNDKQSSIDWFLDELIKEGYIKRLPVTQLQQAKTMHKEEIVNTWSEATSLDYEIGLLDASYILCQIHNAEQYYKETFEGNNEQAIIDYNAMEEESEMDNYNEMKDEQQ